MLRLEHSGVHLRQDLTGLHEIALINQNFFDPPWDLGRNVDLSCFDAAVPTGEPPPAAAAA
jgi:hypothetical protein